jgi:hypothetical protein
MYKEQVWRDLLSGDPQAILQFIMAQSLQLFLHLEKKAGFQSAKLMGFFLALLTALFALVFM